MIRKFLLFIFLSFSISLYSQSHVSISASKANISETGSMDVVATLDTVASNGAVINFKLSGTATKDLDYSTDFTTKGTASTVAGGNGQGNASNQLSYPYDVSVDSAGNIYVLDRSNWRIQKWAPGADTGITVTTLDGDYNSFFVDASGNIYASDEMNNRIQKWTSSDSIWTTVAGGNNQGSNANQLSNPQGVYVDKDGNIFIADAGNYRIQKWIPDADTGITVVGGNGQGWDSNQFYEVKDVSVDLDGNIYVLDYNRIQKWTPGSTVGITVTSGEYSFRHFFVDPYGVIYVSDQYNHQIKKWSPGTTGWTTVAGGNGQGNKVNQLSSPMGIYVDKGGNIFIADYNNHRIQKIQESPQIIIKAGDSTGKITIQAIDDNKDENNETIQLTPTQVTNCILNNTGAISLIINDDDDPPSVSFSLSKDRIVENSATDVVLNANVSEISGKEIDVVFDITGSAVENTDYTLSSDTIKIFAGGSSGMLSVSTKGLDDNVVEPLDSIVFNVDTISNATAESQRVSLYLVSDDNPTLTYSVQKSTFVESDSVDIVATLNAAASRDAVVDFNLSGTAINNLDYTTNFLGKGTATTVAGGNGYGSVTNQLYNPMDVSVDSVGNIYVLDYNNYRIQKWAPDADVGITVTSLNTYGQYFFVDASGNIYVSGQDNSIQKWSPGGTGWTTVAGGNNQGSNDNQLNNPRGVFVDKDGNIYVADQQNHRIQKWAPRASKGVTVAGGNSQGANANQLSNPTDVSVDAAGNIYVLDANNYRIQKWTPNATTGTTVVHLNNYFQHFFVDPSGSIFGIDQNNQSIQKWSPGQTAWTTVAGGNGQGSNSNQLSSPQGIYVDKGGNIYVADQGNHRIQKFQGAPQLVVKAGETTGKLTIKGIDDFVNEDNESIILSPKSHTNCILNNSDTITLTMTDNDDQPAVSFSLSKDRIVENSATDVVLTATSTYISSKDITIGFVMGGSAVDTVDYDLSAHAITIPAGDTTAGLSISTKGLDDTIVEQMDSIIFNVGTITNAQAAMDHATLYLESDDDPSVTISSSATAMAENDSAIITATLNAACSRDAVINFNLSGTATFDNDYTVDFPTKGTATTVAGGNGQGWNNNQLSYPNGVSVDSVGNIYILEPNISRIVKWVPGVDTGITVTNFNGNNFNYFFVDNSGNIYASDENNNRVQKWTPGGTGWTTVAGGNDQGSNADQLSNPRGIYIDKDGNIFIADAGNYRIQKWEPGATKGTTVAGGNGQGYDSDQLYYPFGVSVDKAGNIYTLDPYINRIEKWTPGRDTVSIIASANGLYHFFVEPSGDIYASNSDNHQIQKWTPDSQEWATIAGGKGQGSNSNQLSSPQGIYVDKGGNIYVADQGNHRIQKFQGSPQIVVKAGETTGKLTIKGIDDQANEYTESIVLAPTNVTNCSLNSTDTINIALTDNDDPPVVSFAFNKEKIEENSSTDVSLTATSSQVSGKNIYIKFKTEGSAVDSVDYALSTHGISILAGDTTASLLISTKGLDDTIVEQMDSIIIKVDTIINASVTTSSATLYLESDDDPTVTYTATKDSIAEHQSLDINATLNAPASRDAMINFDFSGTATYDMDYTVDFPTKGLATTVAGGNGQGWDNNQFYAPHDVSVDSAGNVYILDYNRIIKWTTGSTKGITVANLNYNWNGCLFIDQPGNIYISDPDNQNVQEWTPNDSTWTTVAGGNGRGSNANQLNYPQGIFVDKDGNIFVADQQNHRIQKWAPGATEGITVAGGHDGGSAANQLYNPSDVSVDAAGNIYVLDANNYRIQKWAPNATTGTTVVHLNNYFQHFFVDNLGNIYSVDQYNQSIEKWGSNMINTDSTALSTGWITVAGGHGNGSNVNQLSNPQGMFVDKDGNIYVADLDNYRIQKFQETPQLVIKAGETEGKMTIHGIEDDLNNEGNESIIIKPKSATNAIVDFNKSNNITLLDNYKSLTLQENSPFVGLKDGAVAWGDYDHDGDLDVAVMGTSPTEGAVTRLYENKEGVFVNSNQNFAKLFNGDISWVDINKDGWIDLVVSGYDGNEPLTKLYLNVGGKYFQATDDYGLPQLYSSKMAWGDLDNDGDIDLAISGLDENDQFRFYIYYRIDGQDKFIREKATDNWPGFINGDLKIVDIDLDGDNDIIYNGENDQGQTVGRVIYNTYLDSTQSNNNNYYYGSLNLKNSSIAVAKFTNAGQNAMTILTSGENQNGAIQFWSSNALAGTGGAGSENQFPKLENGDIAVADYDNNGLNDIVFTGIDKSGNPITKLYLQNSLGNFIESDIKLQGLRNSSANWVDYDMDGDLDLFLTGIDSTGKAKTLLYESVTANKKNTPPAKITGLKTEDLGNGRIKFSWDTPADDFSTNLGYVVRLGTTPRGTELSNTESDLATGRRLITKPAPIYTNFFETQLDPGIYYWSVQAVDPGLKGGEFSDEASYTLTYEWKILNQGGIIDRRIQGVKDPVIKLADVDNDGDMDLIYASASDNSGVQLLKYDGKRLESSDSNPLSYVQNITDAEVGDVNGDGTPDILINNFSTNNTGNLRLFISDTSSNSYRESNLDNGLYKAKGKIVDLNNDGQAEVVLLGLSSSQTSGKLKFYIYEYDPASGNFNKTDVSDQIASLSDASFDLGDIDNDQDIDLVLSGFSAVHGNESFIYKNVTELGGSYKFEATANNLVAVTNGTCNLIDFDGDGDLDAVFTGSTASDGNVFEVYMNKLNEGVSEWPRLNNIGLTPMYDSKVDLGDFNGDGYSDLLYSGIVQGQGNVTKLSEFVPSTSSYNESSFNVSDITNAEVEFGDIEGDGDLDFAISGESRANPGTYVFRAYVNVRNQSAQVLARQDANRPSINGIKKSHANSGNYTVNVPPSVPLTNTINILDSLIGNQAGIPVEFSWQAATDDHTPVKGLTYALKVGSTPGGDDILSANANADGMRTTAGKGNVEHNLHWRLRIPKGNYYWSVQAIDASYAGSAFSEPMSFTTSGNSSPTDISLSDTTVDENSAIGTMVGKLSSVDADATDIQTYTLVSGDGDTDNSSFTISGDSLRTGEVFDFETKSSYSIRIQTDDGQGGTFSKSFTIVVNDLNENSSPTDVTLSDTTVDENSAIGTVIGKLSSIDADAADAHTYTLVSGDGDTDNSSFTISGDSLRTGEVFDFETKPSYSIRIQTDDGQGGTFSKSFTIAVNDLNENTTPTDISLSDTTVDENSAIGTMVGKLSSVDADATDIQTYTLVSGDGDTDNRSFTISGDSLRTGEVFDFETKSSYSIRIQTDDGQGGTFSKSFTIKIENTTGIDDFSSNVKTYPNPFHGNRLNIDIPFSHPVQLRVMDIYGRVILEKELTQHSNKIIFRNIHDGLYIVQLVDEYKVIYQYKIIKEK